MAAVLGGCESREPPVDQHATFCVRHGDTRRRAVFPTLRLVVKDRAARPGRSDRRDNEYKRCGTANILAVVEPKAGRHFTYATPDRSAAQFAQIVQQIVAAYPFA